MAANVYRRTPGVYITELAAFPPSIVGVQTAVPAFIGYTEKAEIKGKPVHMKAIKVGSMADYEAIFGAGYKPFYTIKPVEETADIQADKYDFKVLDDSKVMKYYKLVDESGLGLPPFAPLPRFNLYDSLRLFYANGGGNCYIVSVGSYPSGESGIDPDLLTKGLDVIRDQAGPTMLLIPDAVLLTPVNSEEPWRAPDSFWTLMNAMVTQAGELQDRVAILDVYGSNYVVDQASLDNVIKVFQDRIDNSYMSYGMAYFPFLDTSVAQAAEVDYQNIADGPSFAELQTILRWENKRLYEKNKSRLDTVEDYIKKMKAIAAGEITTAEQPEEEKTEVRVLNQNLVAALPLLGDIERIIREKNDTLPPSGAMAGIYTLTDFTRGVWNAPANISLRAVVKPTYNLTSEQQGDLNVPVNGKAIDAIRELTGRGTVVWGARTLDGNSRDYRYIQVRRTLIYIEQSIKAALAPFVFAPNDGNTWSTVVSMVSSFLQGVWSQGGLMGATASEAFSVQCGLGSTMTAQDILDGYMRVQILLQMIRPAEFIELTFKQKMEGAG